MTPELLLQMLSENVAVQLDTCMGKRAGCRYMQAMDAPQFEWKPEYSVGIPLIDDDHRVLVFLIAKINSTLGKSDTDREFNLYRRDFKAYCLDHFRREDLLMAGTGFADFEQHADEHKQLLLTLDALDPALDQAFAAPHLMNTWLAYCRALLDHFEISDKPLGEHIRLWLDDNDRSEQDLENNLLRFARYWTTA